MLTCVQPFKPDYLALQKAGFNAVPRLQGEARFDGALMLIGKHRGRNEAWLAQALDHVVPGGLIVVSGDKKLGVDSFRKTVETMAPVKTDFRNTMRSLSGSRGPMSLISIKFKRLRPRQRGWKIAS